MLGVLCFLFIPLQKPVPARAPHVAFLAGIYARVVSAHAVARASPLFRGRATSFDTMRDDSDRSSVGNCSKEASDLIAILKEACRDMHLAGVEWHVTVQCCDAHGRLLKEGSDAFYCLWLVAHTILITCSFDLSACLLFQVPLLHHHRTFLFPEFLQSRGRLT